MNLINKWNEIISWQKENLTNKLADLSNPVSEKQIIKIEALLEESVPFEFRQLYSFADGQESNGDGLLFGDCFVDSNQIIQNLEFSRTLIKPQNPSIENPQKSEELIKKIVDFYTENAPAHKLWGLKKSWYKIEFECGTNSFGGPYLYASENTPSKERINFKIDDYKPIMSTIKTLHKLEEKSYNWDELHFIVYANGTFEVNRNYYDFGEETFTSTPENAIKKKYFHYKWLPVFSDEGGNYIGIDLDPDINGKKGQIINFGRDEDKMVVLADNLEDFFDLMLNQCKQDKGGEFLSQLDKVHLHDILRGIKN
jgi:cell wall assembly regulator SMI1